MSAIAHLLHPPNESINLATLEHLVIGRDEKMAGLAINDNMASRQHCRLYRDNSSHEECWLVEDCQSRNGTWVNRQRIDHSHSLSDRDIIQVGNHQFIYCVLPKGVEPELTDEQESPSDATITMTQIDDTATCSFSGQLSHNSFSELWRYFSMTKKNGMLYFNRQEYSKKNATRVIYFVEGVPRYVQWDSHYGKEALKDIIEQNGNPFHFYERQQCDKEWNCLENPEELALVIGLHLDTRRYHVNDDDIVSASQIQMRLMGDLPQLQQLPIGLHYRAHSMVGGDFYDIDTWHDQSILGIIGDVSGHGMQGAMITASATRAWRILRRTHKDLKQLLSAFNEEMLPDLRGGRFITCCAFTINPQNGLCQLILCGHHQTIILHPNGTIDEIGAYGMAVGIAKKQLFQKTLKVSSARIPPGGCFLQLTDGILEARNSDKQEYGKNSFRSFLESNSHKEPQELVDAIVEDCIKFSPIIEDDITLLAMQYRDDTRGII